ncbi:UNVERIFIED_CONTAM: hypothetical protein K2H54_050860 [Gekko kuhli]
MPVIRLQIMNLIVADIMCNLVALKHAEAIPDDFVERLNWKSAVAHCTDLLVIHIVGTQNMEGDSLGHAGSVSHEWCLKDV